MFKKASTPVNLLKIILSTPETGLDRVIRDVAQQNGTNLNRAPMSRSVISGDIRVTSWNMLRPRVTRANERSLGRM